MKALYPLVEIIPYFLFEILKIRLIKKLISKYFDINFLVIIKKSYHQYISLFFIFSVVWKLYVIFQYGLEILFES